MQDLTPLEIQKQTFARTLKGYSTDEVRGYLHLVAEEIEGLLQSVDRLTRENAMLRSDLDQHSERERILKDTLISAQKVSEDVKANARKEAELTVKDAELLSERLVSQAMSRVSEIQRSIQDLKVERKVARNRLQSMLDTMQQLVVLDAEQEANELPVTAIHRATLTSSS
jgi:cell division initiation protein